MVCKKCGHENKDGARVCESCGASLVEEKNNQNERIKISKETSRKRSERQRKRSKDKDLMTYGMIVGSVLAFAVIFIVLSYFFKLGSNKEMAKKNQVETSSIEATELYEKALNTSDQSIKDGNYEKAIKILKAIPEESGDYYKKGQEKLSDLENLIIDDIKKAVVDKDYKEARNLASTYAGLLPESEKLAKINDKLKANNEDLDKLVAGKEKETEEEDSEEDDENEDTEEDTDRVEEAGDDRSDIAEDYDLEYLRATNSYGQNGNPAYTDIYKESDFLNKDLRIDAHLGEIRTEPNLDSGVAGYVNNGETVHCQEVYNDGGRYWLNIGSGWISSKLITGEFRD